MEERTKYAGQPVGLVVAKDRDTALRAAQMVMVGYDDIQQPILTIKDALAAGGRDEVAVNFVTGKAEASVLGDPEGMSCSGGKIGNVTHQPVVITPLRDLFWRQLWW